MPQKTPDTLSHFDAQGQAHMVDVSTKDITSRIATAAAWIKMSPETLAHVTAGTAKKGDVLGIARTAGIQVAKKPPDLPRPRSNSVGVATPTNERIDEGIVDMCSL